MASILGWKDILRPIRDGYRHLFPSPDTGPTPDQRRKQRDLHYLVGFTYFDTFDQLETWTAQASDSLPRANTALLPRAPILDGKEFGKASVLLCHDYSGNYHDYERVQSALVDEESYTCEHLQFVDTFIYFSHKLVCVPPPAWTNTLHRNGVKALGTILVEPQTRDTERLLQRHSVGDGADNHAAFPVVAKLAQIAKHYGFDGYLINIEKPFPKESWGCSLLEQFLRHLRDALGLDKKVIWYDAITIANKIDFQNALNSNNISFSIASGSILTNYCWNERDARNSKAQAQEHNLPVQNVFFGVDVWAQNTTKITQPRITYPDKGGGGTNTGLAVSKLAEVGLSVGVFAPAWSFEHFPGYGRDMENAVWDGREPWDGITCSCGDVKARHPTNRENPITKSAKHFSAGSEKFFYTDFSRGFRRIKEIQGKGYQCRQFQAQLSSQSVLPHLTRSSLVSEQNRGSIHVLVPNFEDLNDRTQLIIEVMSVELDGDANEMNYEQWLPLFNLNMPADGTLQLRLTYRNLLDPQNGAVSLYLKFSNGVRLLSLGEPDHMQTTEAIVSLEPGTVSPGRLQELGLHIRAPPFAEDSVKIVEVLELGVSPRAILEFQSPCAIQDVRLEKRGDGDNKNWSLCWSHYDENQHRSLSCGMPYSEITGPFAYFMVRIGSVTAGRAYALEYLLPSGLWDELHQASTEVGIIGMGFDGRRLAETSARVQMYA
ncbi:glycosyl hydrolase family 85 protein-like protein [Massariosphaeria phaeospora]|uniref:Glycosyl hydrolase family 85 protein-like protein n=1 Tax=Massariosphaeria phaeospora TaxID=100035 RepID=A0A7C8IFN0_9PLEO|nr:glycosyl hydrolase family 85 protein-like protein [Massariosphaeria phaeospora]